ncbi:serine protease [Azonexus sp.]|jgi:S1-C subfamily serine protease|uniref:S1C family serine protease n=1 Tax=Azonexus sp. TaxID=1872668 RepID=UPI002831DEC9|nr:serine protease [Azonexus sp.]MDR1996701.1 serine protease [Azonexus sp.]
MLRITAASLLALIIVLPAMAADMTGSIARVKPSIVVVGTYQKTASPQFAMRGTGFVVTSGNLAATNAHVIPEDTGPDAPALVIRTRGTDGQPQLRPARVVGRDPDRDLAVLRFEGPPLPAVELSDSDAAREGQMIGFTGFPIGGALGFSPVTHHGMIASITPITLPGSAARQLNEKAIRQIKRGAFDIFQLDATAYPGNSGSPVFDAASGEVIGIINMVFIKGSKESALSQPSGISYAIPANYLKRLLDTL